MKQPQQDPDQGPLEQIEAEHNLQLQVLAKLERIIKAADSRELPQFAPKLLDFFANDFARHIEHEEKGLFPILKKRCRPVDDLEMIVNQLSYEHELDRDLVDFLCGDLEKIARGRHSSTPARFSINAQAFIETQRRHIGWENRIVLPLARKRLTEEDIKVLKKLMESD